MVIKGLVISIFCMCFPRELLQERVRRWFILLITKWEESLASLTGPWSGRARDGSALCSHWFPEGVQLSGPGLKEALPVPAMAIAESCWWSGPSWRTPLLRLAEDVLLLFPLSQANSQGSGNIWKSPCCNYSSHRSVGWRRRQFPVCRPSSKF